MRLLAAARLVVFCVLAACAVSAAPSSSPSDALPPTATRCPKPYDTHPPVPGWNRGFSAGGQSRSFYLLLPAQLSMPAPVFVAFNGTSEDASEFVARAHLERFAAKGFVVIAPSSAGNGSFWPVWDGLRAKGHESDPNPDVALFDRLLACVATRIPIDRDRVYVGGHSAGGIFTNHLIQRRSQVIAGAIVGSGVFSQTTPDPPVPLDPMTVIVTWGGDDDRWTGRAGGTAVRDFGFAAEAVAASQAYAKAPGFGVVSCEGDGRGHAWLDDLDDWMADLLLAHPKGAPPVTELPPLPPGARAACHVGPASMKEVRTLDCPESATPGCQLVCEELAAGAVANRTLQPVLRGELAHLGFTAPGCGGCIAHCEATARSDADADVLGCLATQPRVDPTVPGIAGAMPLIDAVNTCCAGRSDSEWCADTCDTMRHNLAARPYFDKCPR